MLKQRIFTAMILIPLVVLAIFLLPTLAFMSLVAVAALLIGWEWLQIAVTKGCYSKLLLLALWLLLSALAMVRLPIDATILAGGSVWLLLAVLIAVYANKPMPALLQSLFQSRLFALLTAWLILLLFFYSATWLHGRAGDGAFLVFHVLMVVWLTDTGGYIAGKRWGKHKLARVISPNKTWEGVIGGLLLVMLWTVVALLIGLPEGLGWAGWLLLSGLTALISVAGDLFESLFKRSHAVKDSGHLLPGHGGLWDRLDSLLAALPAFAASLMLLGV